MSTTPQPQQPSPMQVHGEPEMLKGHYANVFAITSQERDVVVDFFSHVNVGNQPAQLVSRVFLNHFTARELIELLQKNLENWEKMRYEQTGQK